jgi:DNA primase
MHPAADHADHAPHAPRTVRTVRAQGKCDLDAVLGRLSHLRWNGSQGTACCPVHEADGRRHRPSLSVGVGRGGRILLHCFAGCSHAAIVAALGLAGDDLRTNRDAQVVVRTRVTLRDVEAGREYVQACVARLDTAAGGQALGYLAQRFGIGRELAAELFLGYDSGARTIERPGCCGPAFQIPRLVVPLIVGGGFTGFQARTLGVHEPRWAGPTGAGWGRVGTFALERRGPVVLCEGPSDALAVAGIGYAAAFARGAGLCEKASSVRRTLTPLVDDLRARTVVVAGDGDEAGRRFARGVAGFLRGVGVGVRTCDPGDGLDLAAVRQRQGVEALRAQLEEVHRA